MYNEIAYGKVCWENMQRILEPHDLELFNEQEQMIKEKGAEETFNKFHFERNLKPEVCMLILWAFKYVEFKNSLEESKN